MTEKRFIVDDDGIVTDMLDLSMYIDNEDCCEKLNELHDENQELQGNYDAQKQLFCQLNSDKNNIWQDYQDLKKENEQLKSVVKEVIELLSEEVDLFSDKATEHDINAYIELKELDNKDAYYMATATKKAIKLLKRVADD